MRLPVVAAILSVLLAASVRAQPAGNVRVSTTWRGAEVEGRTLWVNEQSVTLRVDARTQVEVGWQRFVAKGRVRRNRFSTSSRWYGLQHVLRQETDRQLVLSLRRLEASEGTADVAEGLFTYKAPRIDTTSLLSLQRDGKQTTGYRLSYSRTHAGTEAADTVALTYVVSPARAARWQVQIEGGVYADRHRDTTYRSVFAATISSRLGRGLRAWLGVTFAPRGFPTAGTSMEALTAFSLYRPGSLIENWRDRPAGFLSVQITSSLD
jgi:hypothetical protein